VHLAAAHGLQAEAMERLHRLYFSEGALIADAESLVEAAVELGLPAEETRAMLADPRAFADDVRADERLAGQFGLNGVPAFVIDRKYLISGAQPPEYMLAALQQAWSEAPAAIGD
jgi:predicted DsbA family dithiol-disulfide isomerase